MASHFKGHKVTAILVVVAAAAWVATGKFASVGSEEAHAAQPAPDTTSIELAQDDNAAPASVLRTVAALTPVFEDHAREIRISGVTGADKRTVLAARSDGIIAALPIAGIGPRIEHDPLFPERVNAGFAQVLTRDCIRLRVWERGAGLTLACGTGACAALVAAQRRGLVKREAVIIADGGELPVRWGSDGHVHLSGPVEMETGLDLEGLL